MYRAVIDSTDIDISIHIIKYRYIDTHFNIVIYRLEKFLRTFLSIFHEKSLFSCQRTVHSLSVFKEKIQLKANFHQYVDISIYWRYFSFHILISSIR